MKLNTGKNIALLAATIFLFFAFVDGLPYGFFTLLRFVVCASSIFAAFVAHEFEKGLFVWFFSLFAFLFNPIIPIHLNREIWLVIDAIVGTFMLVSVFALKQNKGKRIINEKV